MRMDQNINNAFFNGIYKKVWRQLIPAGLTEAETDFIEVVADLQKTQKVLDIMCGYGRHSLQLARRGYGVTAVDNAPEYIAEIKENASANGLPIEAVCTSALNFKTAETFDAAICMGNSFAFFSEAETLEILQKLSAQLKRGGVFIINTWMLGEIAIKHFREKDWFYAGDYKYLIDNKYFFQPARIESEHTIIQPDGTTETIKGIDYIFTIAELNTLFSKTGFSPATVYATPRKKQFQHGDSRAYLVTTKL